LVGSIVVWRVMHAEFQISLVRDWKMQWVFLYLTISLEALLGCTTFGKQTVNVSAESKWSRQKEL
jgi:hypothetical protein